jgi:TonB-dependent starch-binding outer membrane protein SusC
MKQLFRLVASFGIASACFAYSANAQLLASNTRQMPQSSEMRPESPQMTPLKGVLSNLERRYKVSFIYRSELVDTKILATDLRKTANVEEQLQNVLANSGLTFEKVRDNFYIILLKEQKKEKVLKKLNKVGFQEMTSPNVNERGMTTPQLLTNRIGQLGLITTSSIDRTVRGSITDSETGSTLAGVSVVVKGTNRGVTTDGQGRYSLSVPDGATTLVFSFIGYAPQEVAVGPSRSIIDLALAPSTSTLNEVVVVGYGTQKKTSVTGAISQVGAKEMAALPVIDVRQALQGRAAGVSVVNNGAPGEDPIVRIRGIGSISYASNPLYVVDGFITGDLSALDTRDVESVEVLKDAAAAAIYGSRAANGVIVLTTKKAKNDGKVHVELDSYYGSQTAWRTLDLLNREEYLRYGTALRQGAGQALPPQFTRMNDPIYAGATQTFAQTDTDWQKEMFRTAPVTQTTISVSSGNDKSRVYVSGGYFKQDGIMLGTGYERFNFRINSEHNLGKRFTFGQSATVGNDYRLNENNPGGRSQIQNMMRMTPYIPVYNPTNIGGFGGNTGADGSDPQNPVRAAMMDRSRNKRTRILATGYLEAKIIDGLKYRFTAGMDFNTGMTLLNNPIYQEGFNARAFNRVEQNRFTGVTPYFSNQLTFDKTFGKHYVNAIAVAERQDGRFRSLSTGGQYTTNELVEVTNTLQDPGVNGFLSESTLYSYIGRLNYEYDNKYLLSASFRRDGSSVFAPGNQWGNFPSVSLGWRLSEEAFMKTISAISELKLRGSYGLMGFNGIPNYSWQPVLAQNTAPVLGGGRAQGTYFDFLGNTNLTWEITKMTNVGVDLGLFNNRVTFQAEYFNRVTDGLILNQPLSPSLGFSQLTPANVGAMRNWGVEFQAGYRQNKGGFRWEASGNLSVIRNRVESLVSPIFDGQNADFTGDSPVTRTVVGEPVQSFFGYIVDGIFQNQGEIDRANANAVQRSGKADAKFQEKAAPGDLRFQDANGDGIINGDDRVNLGSFIPNFSYGINLSANWKGFDATMFIQGVQGNKVYNGTKSIGQGMLRLFNSTTDVLNAWTPQNTNTDVPRAVDGDPNGNIRPSTRFLEDGSYLRLKNLSIGYNIPVSALQSFTKGGISKARVYVSSMNLLTFTKYTGYDPEIGSRFGGNLTNGIDYGQFPAARTILFGIQVGF